MSLQVIVTPSETFPDGQPVDNAALRRGALPTVNISGAVDAGAIPDGSLTDPKFAAANINLGRVGLPASITSGLLGAGSVTAAATEPDDYFYGAATTTGTVIAFVPPVTPAAYAAGMRFYFKADVATPSGGVTVNVNGLGAVALVKGGAAALALAANDYAAGAIVEIAYDGTQFQLCSPYAVTSPQIAGQTKNLICQNHLYGQANIGSLTRVTTTATFAFANPATPSFTTGETIWIAGAKATNYDGAFAVTVTGTSGGLPTTMTYVVTNAGATPDVNVAFAFSSHLIDLTADQAVLQDANGNGFLASAVSVTIDANAVVNNTTVLNNALDTGTLAASTWYYLWLIYNGTTVAGLLSLSATAPTLPTGYTLGKALEGAVYSDANKLIRPFRQTQQRVSWVNSLTLLSANSAGTSGAWTASTLANLGIAPPNAKSLSGTMGVSTASVAGAITVASDAAGTGMQTWAGAGSTVSDNGFFGGAPFELLAGPGFGIAATTFAFRTPDAGAHYQIMAGGFTL